MYPNDPFGIPTFHVQPPPSAVRFLRNAFSASPAVQIRPGPLGSLAELRKYRRKSPDFFLKTWQLQRKEEVPKWATQCSVWFQVVHQGLLCCFWRTRFRSSEKCFNATLSPKVIWQENGYSPCLSKKTKSNGSDSCCYHHQVEKIISTHLTSSETQQWPWPPIAPIGTHLQIADRFNVDCKEEVAQSHWCWLSWCGNWLIQTTPNLKRKRKKLLLYRYLHSPPPYSSQKVHIQIPNFPSILVINSFLLSNLAHPKKQNRLNHQQPTTHEPLNRHNNSTTPSLEHQLPWAWDQNHRFGKRCSKVPPPRTKSSPCNHPTHLPRLATQMIDEENRSFFSWQIWEVGRIKEGRDCRITDEFRFCEFYDISVAVNKTWSQVRHVLSLKTTRSSCFVIRCLYFSRGETTSTIRRHSATMRIKDPPLTSLEDQLDHPRTGPRKCLRSMVIVFCPLGIGLWDPSQMAEIHGL